MNEKILDIASQRFDQEISNLQQLNAKAGALIGYSGVLIAFVTFLYDLECKTNTQCNNNGLLAGMVLMLFSIFSALIILTPLTKKRPVFLVNKFIKYHENSDDPTVIDQAVKTYQDLIETASGRAKFKAWTLYIGNILLGLGILISFISIFYK